MILLQTGIAKWREMRSERKKLREMRSERKKWREKVGDQKILTANRTHHAH